MDIKIVNGQVLDGTGGASVRTDVGIRGDRIVAIGDLSAAQADAVVDAAGKFVCPGFIDVHSHSDTHLLFEPLAPSKVTQGITTEVVGNCGASAAPLMGAYRIPSDWSDKPLPRAWSTVKEYRQLLDEIQPGLNVALLVGHNTLRAGVIGYEARAAQPHEFAEMARRLEQGLDEGARGLSSGLIYAPGSWAPHEELVELARVAARRGGIYTSHMRSEGKRLLAAIAETLDIGAQTGCAVEISHLKAAGRANWGLTDQALDLIRAARARGVRVAADRYPYIAACTDLDVMLPDWAAEGGRTAILARLRDPEKKARIREDVLKARDAEYWTLVMIGSSPHPEFKGRKLTDVARELGCEPVDAALHLMDMDELRTSAIFFGMSEEGMWQILAEPYVMLGSDASLRAPWGVLGQDHPHPRAYGTFTLFLKAALGGRTVPLPEAIRKMTSFPAAHFGLKDRGVLARGKAADIVVFDPAVTDMATYAQPQQFSRGIDCVIVNGAMTMAGGKLTGRRAGRFL